MYFVDRKSIATDNLIDDLIMIRVIPVRHIENNTLTNVTGD